MQLQVYVQLIQMGKQAGKCLLFLIRSGRSKGLGALLLRTVAAVYCGRMRHWVSLTPRCKHVSLKTSDSARACTVLFGVNLRKRTPASRERKELCQSGNGELGACREWIVSTDGLLWKEAGSGCVLRPDRGKANSHAGPSPPFPPRRRACPGELWDV